MYAQFSRIFDKRWQEHETVTGLKLVNSMKGGICLLSDVFSSSDILTVTVSEHRSELLKGKGGKVGRVRGGRRGGVKVSSTHCQ